MKCHLLFLITPSLLVYGATLNDRENRVVGGHGAKENSRPYLVSIQMRFLFIRAHICGGSILNENWVLTAGHCLENFLIRWLPLEAIAGAHHIDNFNSDVQKNSIVKRVPNPLYKGGIESNDIAVVKTAKPFVFDSKVQPIALPNRNFKIEDIRSNVLLAGWGALKSAVFIPEMPTYLQEVEVPLLSFADCYKAISEIAQNLSEVNPLDENAHICTGPLSGGTAACSGDSGGPLVQLYNETLIEQENNDPVIAALKKEDKTDVNATTLLNGLRKFYKYREKAMEFKPVVLGVVSWGTAPCGSEGAPTVYTKVSNYLDFINEYINEK